MKENEAIMDGILVVNKPKGITSHDVVDVVRNKFNIRRVGHTGTLDPMATGVLVVLVGKATKLANKFIEEDKEYIAKLFLGKRTDTQDATGKIIEERRCTCPSEDRVKDALQGFVGERDQVPPLFSAIKYKGRKMYEFARQGKVVPRKSRKIIIKDIELVGIDFPEITFRVRCSKGTYVRALCEDIGSALGCLCHMSGLVRIRSGDFLLKDAKSLEGISEKDIMLV